jgi:uncharacterized protein (DUF927 family)
MANQKKGLPRAEGQASAKLSDRARNDSLDVSAHAACVNPPAPDKKVIRSFLEMIAAPAREQFGDALIEIAWDDGADGTKNNVGNAKLFPLDQLDAAAALAANKNALKRNVYVGAFLKKQDTSRNKRTKGGDFYVATYMPTDADEDAAGVNARLTALGVRPEACVTTGRTPSLREQSWFRLAEPCADPGIIERAFKNVVASVGADNSATGLNRLMRLAGSVSYPPGKKRALGYIVEQTTLAIDEEAQLVNIDVLVGLPKTEKPAAKRKRGSKGRFATPPAPAMKVLLEFLAAKNFFGDYDGVVEEDGRIVNVSWIQAGMALRLSYGDEAGAELWSVTHDSDEARREAEKHWRSFEEEPSSDKKQVTIGTLIKAAEDAGFEFPAFTNTADSVYFYNSSRNRYDRMSAGFEIFGQSREVDGDNWGKALRWKDPDGKMHIRIVKGTELIGAAGQKLCGELMSGGLHIDPAYYNQFLRYIAITKGDNKIVVVTRTGWHDMDGNRVFALPDRVICPSDDAEGVVFDPAVSKHAGYAARGTLDDWKQRVAAPAGDHLTMIFAISTALAGPLLYIAGEESGGVHLVGGSSEGKTTLMRVAASVYGGSSFMKQWRATSNGLEGAADLANDALLALDEFGQVDARHIGDTLYMLANGSGKARMRADATLREIRQWRVMVLSSGEITIAAKLAEGGKFKKTRAGQFVRMLDVNADRGKGHGVFDHGPGAELSKKFERATAQNYGTAGPAFIEGLVRHETTGDDVRSAIDAFVAENASGLTGQAQRAARRFGLIAAAGELAIKFGVVPWKKGKPTEAAAWACKQWTDAHGGMTESFEVQQAIEQVRSFLERYGESRFDPVGGNYNGGVPSHIINDRAGWRRMQKDGSLRDWCILPGVWKEQVCSGLDGRAVAKILAERGMLVRDEGRYTKKVKANGRTPWVYVVLPTIMEGHDEISERTDDDEEQAPELAANDANVHVLFGADGKPQRPKK